MNKDMRAMADGVQTRTQVPAFSDRLSHAVQQWDTAPSVFASLSCTLLRSADR
jgi:hypothetical protein